MKSMFTGIVWVAGVYFYFLVYAQFAFLEMFSRCGSAPGALKLVMGAMALGGIVGSVLVLPLQKVFCWGHLMRATAFFCSLFPLLSVLGQRWTFGAVGYSALALGVGLGLGGLTVLLAANLPGLVRHAYLGAGLGTGAAYMLSNLPWVFQSPPEWQCYVSAGAVFFLSLLPVRPGVAPCVEGEPWGLRRFSTGLAWFAMLVWLDSAAFYIIQHNEGIKLGTWGEGMLWRNAAVHLLGAILSGWLLLKGRIIVVLVSAFALLGLAGLMASEASLRPVAGFLYPVGVSLYSVALVIYPAVWLGQRGATLRAAVLFAVAGWVGSAMGIGMAQDLSRVPWSFVVVAGCVMAFPYVWKVIIRRKREVLVSVPIAMVCIACLQLGEVPPSFPDQVSKGRAVYVSEGCIHCHSRYVRNDTMDVLLWGPARDAGDVTGEQPVLIGNRRQGPDLLMVGVRRSKGWLRQHFLNPRSLVPNSSMPSYAHLFGDDRGEALVSYLAMHDPSDVEKRWETILRWQPREGEVPQPKDFARELFGKHCAACHGKGGKGDGHLSHLWEKPPANLMDGPFAYTAGSDPMPMLRRVIKFGIPGTDMPGHETLADADVEALAGYVKMLRENKNPEKR